MATATIRSGRVILEDNSDQPVLRAFANAAALGDNLVVSAVAGKKIRVLAWYAMATLAVSVHFRSAANPISATLPFPATGGMNAPHTDHGWFETNPGEALNVNLGLATATGVQVVYVLV